MKTCKELAAEWGIAERTIVNMCKTGKIRGALKVGKQWQIPDDAKRPVDGRIVTGKYIKNTRKLFR